MRTIVRFSLNGDTSSRLRNALFKILEDGGLAWTGAKTATYEGQVSEANLRDTMRKFWNRTNSYTGPAHLDHFWMYCDKTGEPTENDEG